MSAHVQRAAGGAMVVRGAALVLVLAGAASAQPQTEFPSAVELVTVDVLVVDRSGRSVTGLGRDDFELREEGRVQPIVAFEALEAGTDAAPPPDASLAVLGPVASNEKSRKPVRTFLIVFDAAHLTPLSADRARQAVARFLEDRAVDGAAVTVLVPATGLRLSALLPEGRAELVAAVSSLQGRRALAPGNFHVGDDEACRIHLRDDDEAAAQVFRRWLANGDLPAPAAGRSSDERHPGDSRVTGAAAGLIRARAIEVCSLARARRRATLDAMADAIGELQGRRGRKSVHLFSDGFPHEPGALEFRRLHEAARAANAAVDLVDPGDTFVGPAMHEADVMSLTSDAGDVGAALHEPRRDAAGAVSVALDTGGSVLRGSRLAERLGRLADESRSSYLLGFLPGAPAASDEFRKISVRVRRKDVRVRARKGYYPVPRTAPVSPLRLAAESAFDETDLPARVAAYVLGPGASGRTQVVLVGETDPDASPGAGSRQALLAVSGEADARHEATIPLAEPTSIHHLLELPPGEYDVRFVVRDPETGRLGSARRSLRVPPAAEFRVTTPILTDRLVRTVDGDVPVPTAHRRFPGTAKVYALFDVVGATREDGAPRVSVASQVQDATGRVLTAQPTQPLPAGPDGLLRQTLVLPLAGVSGGRYELLVAARDEITGLTTERREPFEIDAPETATPAAAPDARAAALLHLVAGRRLAPREPAAAEVHLERARELARAAGPDFEARFAYALGLLALSRSRFDQAERAFQLATKGSLAAEAHLGLGTVAEARVRLRLTAQSEPPPIGSMMLRTFLHRARLDDLVDSAEEHYRRALALDPGLEAASLRLGHVLAERGASREAIATLHEVARSEDDTRAMLARLVLGDLAGREDRWLVAVRHYRAALERDPGSQAARVVLVHALVRAGRRDEARRVAREAATLAPPPPGALDGWSAYLIGTSRRLDAVVDDLRGASR